MTLANIAFPWLWPHWRVALTLVTACLLAECLLVRRLASISHARAYAVTALVNALSTIVGLPLRTFADWLVFDVGEIPLGFSGNYIFLALFVGTVLVEWPLLSAFLKLPAGRALRISLAANSLSYFLLMFTFSPLFEMMIM